MIQYIVVAIKTANDNFEMISAALLEVGFDSFCEEANNLLAYIEETEFDEVELDATLEKFKSQFELSYSYKLLENKNWNEEWESNFEPVKVGQACIVRASFHAADQPYEYDIVINPKMSFGTGHHETTHMMLEHVLKMDIEGTTLMDAGSGTGILSILAAMRGAKNIVAFDIEDWAYHNAVENAAMNKCAHIHVLQGTIDTLQLPFDTYDIILANINKNVLLEEISVYYKFLKTGGKLVLSGFFENDVTDIDSKAKELNYLLEKIDVNNNWASVIYSKT